jgi:uncharacterized protein YfaS (alpha-2-macroglobulin family)
MSRRRGCGVLALGALFVVVGCLVFAALAAALVLTGEIPLYPPRVTGLQPDPNFAFQPTTPFTVTFDQPMDRDSVEANLVLQPDVTGTFRWNETSTAVTFVPVEEGYEPGTTQTVHLEAGARAGTLPLVMKSSLEWSFALPPLLEEIAPSTGAEERGAHTALVASFGYPLDCEATSRTFSIVPEADGALECEGQTFAFRPTSPLRAGTRYAAILHSVYLADDPWPRQPVLWEFDTAPALRIQEVQPSETEPLHDLWSQFRIRFNRPVLADSAGSRFSLVGSDGMTVDGQLRWEDGGASLVFHPAEPLRPANDYRLTLQGGVEDELGFVLAEGLELAYSTPAMVGVPSPAPGETDVALDAAIRIPFLRPMDEASVEAGLEISPSQEGVITWEEGTLVFEPRGGLLPETDYHVSLRPDLLDASGAPLAEPMRWGFSTEPFLVEAQLPSGVPLAELGQPLEFSFALPMDRASVAAALTISPTTAVDLLWSDDSQTVTVEPELAWLSGAEYEIALSGAARTADRQQSLAEDMAYAFTTAVSEVRFGEGPNLQLINSAADRAVQIVARGADVADLHLYAITETQLLELYDPGFWVATPEPEQRQLLDTQALTPTVAWREALSYLGEVLGEGWHQAEVHIPAEAEPGLYVLTGEPPSDERSQLLVVLTEHALVLKQALAGVGEQTRDQVVVWDAELGTGTPVVSSTVRLVDDGGASLGEGVTDADGLLRLDIPSQGGATLALADKDGDVTVCGLGNEWIAPDLWLWGGIGESQPSRPLYAVYPYTGRPIYRPGHEVYFKDLIRVDDDAVYSLPPPDLPVSVRLRDGRNNIVASQVLTPTQYGTVYGSFELADETMLGTWHIETELDGLSVEQAFQVEEYRKPEYGVSVWTPQKAYVPGETISVTVDADYYFGQPVAGADVVLSAYAVRADDLFYEGMLYYDASMLVSEGQTDSDGRWTAGVPVGELDSLRGGQERSTLALEATVTDEAGQSVSSYQLVTVQQAEVGLALLLERNGYEPDEEIVLTVLARDRDGEPVAGLELVARALARGEEEVASAAGITDDQGRAGFSLQLAEQGWYALSVSGTGEAGNAFQAEDQVWVYDPEGLAPVYAGAWGEEAALSIDADRAAYAVGDAAQLLVQAPVAGTALLSFERGETHQIMPVTLVAGTNVISVPVRADYAPNIHVSLSQFGPSRDPLWAQENRPEPQLQTASTELLVPMDDRRLTVTLTADRDAYSPGDEATFHLQVTDAQGQPKEAEVSLSVVDEAIYALAEDTSADLFDAFYGKRPNLVWTFDSMSPLRWLYGEGFGGMGGDGNGLGGAPRRDFLDTALWAPALTTDEDGEAAITIELPDNLTEWRVVARAITTDTLVGEASTQVLVSQDIVIQPVVPRFLVQGDALSLAAVVRNFTSEPVSATVQLEVSGLVLDGDSRQVVHVPADGSATASWPVAADLALADMGDASAAAEIAISATASRGTRLAGRDAIALSLPVVPLAVPEVTTWAGELTPLSPTNTMTLTLPSDVVTATSHLEIRLSRSLTAGLLDGLEYLIDYPYGCVEQTMSRVLPNAVVSQAFSELGTRSELLETDLPPMVSQGLQRLYAFQHEDGGWGWWYDDATDAHQTAYVLFGLAMTERAGFEVDEGVLALGAEALRTMLPEADPPTQAHGAYSLVMAGQAVTVTLNLTEALQLDLFSQAALAVALDSGDELLPGPDSPEAMVAALLESLREAAVQNGTMVHWEEAGEDPAYLREAMGSTERTTAMVLDALVRLEPADPLLPGAARWLMARRQGRGWGDTQKTSYAVIALTGYALATEAQVAETPFAVYINGELWEEGVLTQAAGAVTYTLSLGELEPGENGVQVVLGDGGMAPGRLYYSGAAYVDRAPGEEGIQALSPRERSIAVRREYRLEGSDEPAYEFQQGDLVEVRLVLDVPEESWYVVVDDPLPAGLEALNERLGTASYAAGAGLGPVYYWEAYGYNRKEVRDDRVSLFITRLEPGEITFSYLARATSSGSFAALPAEVYPMYDAEAWSRSDAVYLHIEAR